MKRRLIVFAAVGSVALATVSIGSAGTTMLKVSAQKTALEYNVSKLHAKAGTITIAMSNPSVMPHNVAVKGKGIKTVKGKVVFKGGISKVTVTLKPGTYRFFCSVPGHEAAGMYGMLVVHK
jgi:plastocyanin